MQADSSLKDSGISVNSVNKGVVLLAGTAKTLSAHLRAVEVVAAVPGVERVASEIKSPDTLADAEIWHEPTARVSGTEYQKLDTPSDLLETPSDPPTDASTTRSGRRATWSRRSASIPGRCSPGLRLRRD